MTSSPAFSVLIASWNCWKDLERCLQSILDDPEAGSSFEIIVVDNASRDETPSKLGKAFPEVRLLRNDENLGHTRAINQATEIARGEFLLVLDADTVVVPGAFARLLSFLRARPDVFVVAPRMFNSDGSIQETARSFPEPINGLLGRQSILTTWFPNNRYVKRYLRAECRSASEPFAVDWVSAACMMYPAALVRIIGPWDEGYHSYWVDADWCMRAGKAGGSVYCLPEAQVVHFEQNRRGKRKSARRILWFHQSVNRFYRKHYTWGLWDPRALAAAMALYARAALLVMGNLFLPVDEVAESSTRAEPSAVAQRERAARRAAGVGSPRHSMKTEPKASPGARAVGVGPHGTNEETRKPIAVLSERIEENEGSHAPGS